MAISDPTRGRFIAIALTLVLFCAGAIAGAAVERLWLAPHSSERVHATERHSPNEPPEVLVERFRRHLDLDDRQAHEIAKIIARLQDEARAIHENTMNVYRATHERARAQIIELLDAEQAIKFQAMHDSAHDGHRGHHGDAGHQPPTHTSHSHP